MFSSSCVYVRGRRFCLSIFVVVVWSDLCEYLRTVRSLLPGDYILVSVSFNRARLLCKRSIDPCLRIKYLNGLLWGEVVLNEVYMNDNIDQ